MYFWWLFWGRVTGRQWDIWAIKHLLSVRYHCRSLLIAEESPVCPDFPTYWLQTCSFSQYKKTVSDILMRCWNSPKGTLLYSKLRNRRAVNSHCAAAQLTGSVWLSCRFLCIRQGQRKEEHKASEGLKSGLLMAFWRRKPHLLHGHNLL